VVFPDHEGSRIDIYLAAVTDLSRRAARRLLAGGEVWHNGRPVRVQSRTLKTGDVVDVLRPASELGIGDSPAVAHPTVLHLDSWLIAAAKPAGMLSATAEKMRPGELAFDQQLLLSRAAEEGKRPFLRMVHRLDRTTSGAILFARTREALAPLTAAWAERRVKRTYLAIVEGHPTFERTTIDQPIARDRSHAWRFSIEPGGKPATTEARLVSLLESGLSVVECRLITGRTHQVRLHLSSIGHPVVGDRLYGSTRADEVERALLHAASITLPHPRSRKNLHIVCPPPDDMSAFLPGDLET
jgi:23S rRNA pseudouridine1911/1915/1917 synthase